MISDVPFMHLKRNNARICSVRWHTRKGRWPWRSC